MTTSGTETLDTASLLALLGPQLTAEQATFIFQQRQDAVVFALLSLAKQLAEKTAGTPTGTDPSAPSGQTPPYLGHTLSGRAIHRTGFLISSTRLADRPLSLGMRRRGLLMGCRGVHFALTDAEVEHLRSLPSERDRLDYVVENLEDMYFSEREEYLAESDKAWDAMHRALADGELTWDGGEYPLNHVVLAGELLYTEPDYIMSLKSPEQVLDIAAALPDVTETGFRGRYFAIDPESYDCPVNEEDFAYTWAWFQNVRRLYTKAAAENRYVLFTADQ